MKRKQDAVTAAPVPAATTVLDDLVAREERDDQAATQQAWGVYFQILRREVEGTQLPSDGAALFEVSRDLGRSRDDVDHDIEVVRAVVGHLKVAPGMKAKNAAAAAARAAFRRFEKDQEAALILARQTRDRIVAESDACMYGRQRLEALRRNNAALLAAVDIPE